MNTEDFMDLMMPTMDDDEDDDDIKNKYELSYYEAEQIMSKKYCEFEYEFKDITKSFLAGYDYCLEKNAYKIFMLGYDCIINKVLKHLNKEEKSKEVEMNNNTLTFIIRQGIPKDSLCKTCSNFQCNGFIEKVIDCPNYEEEKAKELK